MAKNDFGSFAIFATITSMTFELRSYKVRNVIGQSTDGPTLSHRPTLDNPKTIPSRK